jgi:L-glutamine-phosphate cytidylyltransferase
MRIVILAAGKGSRFNDPETPKALTELVNGLSILEFQLLNIEKYLSLDDVEIVVGFQKEKIMSKFHNLKFIINRHYAQENTSKSLLKALEHTDQDVLWMNGDVVFHPSVLEKLILSDKTGMVVNVGVVGEEEVKYRTDLAGNIVEVSKTVDEAEGEALGINLFKMADLPLLKKNLQLCLPNDYFEKGIEGCIKEDIAIQAISIERSLCAEVDFPEDLELANRYIQSWSN